MTTTCIHCGKAIEAGASSCPHCKKPLVGTSTGSTADTLNFDDFFELKSTGPASSSAPSEPSSPPPSKIVEPPPGPPPLPTAAAPQPTEKIFAAGGIIEEVSSDSEVSQELLGDLGVLGASSEGDAEKIAPPPPPPAAPVSIPAVTSNLPPTSTSAPAKVEGKFNDSLDADFEDLFQDDVAAMPPIKTAPPPKKSAPSVPDPRREPETEEAAVTANQTAVPPTKNLEELFRDPKAPPFAEKISKDDSESLGKMLDEERSSGGSGKALWKKPAVTVPAALVLVLFGIAGFSIFAPKKKVPGFLLELRRLYHGGPSEKERQAMLERVKLIGAEILVDRYDVYEKSLGELDGISKRDSDQYLAKVYSAIGKNLIIFDVASDKSEDKTVQELLTNLTNLPSQDQPTELPLAKALYHLRLRSLEKIEPLLARLPSSPLSNFVKGEFYYLKGDLVQATHFWNSEPRFLRSQLHAATLGAQPNEVVTRLNDLIKLDPNYTMAQVALLTNNNTSLSADTIMQAEKLLTSQTNRLSAYEKSRLYFIQYDHTPKSAELIKKAYELDSANPELAHLYGRAIMNSDTEQALIVLRKAATLAPKNFGYRASLAEALRVKGELAEAEKELRAALAESPKDMNCLLELGRVMLATNNIEETKKLMQQLLSLYPDNVPAKLIMAELALNEGNSTQAITLLKNTLSSSEHRLPASLHLADAYFKEDQPKLALATLKSVEKSHPNQAMLLAKLAKAQALLGNKAEAMIALQKALAADPNHRTILWMAAEVARSVQNYAQATEPLKKLVELDEKNLDYRTLLGRNYLDMNDGAAALTVLQEANARKSDDAMIRHYLGVAYRQIGNYEQAIAEMIKSMQIKPDYKSSYFEIALTYDLFTDYQNAIKNLETLLKMDPAHVRGTLLIADVYVKIGSNEKAIPYYKRYIKGAPKDWENRIKLGNCYLKIAQPLEAVKQFQDAIKINPKSAEAYLGIGRYFEERNDSLQAVRFYLKASQLDNKNPEAYYRLGYAYKDLGKRSQATVAFKKYINLDPNSPNKSVVEEELNDLQGK